jgi:hypothetical protein
MLSCCSFVTARRQLLTAAFKNKIALPAYVNCWLQMKMAYVFIWSKWCFFLKYYSLRADPLYLHENKLSQFIYSMSEITVLQIILESHALLNSTVFIATICILKVESCINNVKQKLQNMPPPHTPVQETRYFRQLWVYVFQIDNLKKVTFLSRPVSERVS